MNKRPAERSPSVVTQRRLLAATQDAIRETGIGGATAREITRRADANLAAIPYHFGTKDALLAAALIDDAQRLLQPVLDLLGSAEPAPARAAGAVAILTRTLDAARDRIPVLLAAVARAPHDAEVAGALGGMWSEVRGALAREIRTLVDGGHAAAWVDPDAMAALIVAGVSGVLVAAVVDPDGPSADAVAAQLLGLLLGATGSAGPP